MHTLISRVWLVAIALLATLLPDAVSAQMNLGNVIGNVGSALSPGFTAGDGSFVSIADNLVLSVRPLLILIAGVMIVIQGYRMIIGQEDNIADKAKTTITACLAGIVMLYLYGPFVRGFYGVGGEIMRGNVDQGAIEISVQVAGIINWVLMLVAAIAVAMIVVSGLRAIFESGSEDGVARVRKTVISVAAGIFILVLRGVINRIFGLTPPDQGVSTDVPQPNAIAAIQAAITVIQYFLGFLGIIAVAIIIYAGVLMILDMGNEDRYKQAKGIITRAVIGLVVLLVSLALVTFVVDFI